MKPAKFLIKQSGVTLIEMLVTISIAAILAAIAAPSFKSIIQDAAINKANSYLLDGLMFARSEAVTGNQTVIVCPSTDGTTCSGADWSKGWLVWADKNSNGVLNPSGDTILRVGAAVKLPLEVTASTAWGSSPSFIRFFPQGVTDTSATFTFCDARGVAFANAVVIYTFGGVQPTKKQVDGGPLTCGPVAS